MDTSEERRLASNMGASELCAEKSGLVKYPYCTMPREIASRRRLAAATMWSVGVLPTCLPRAVRVRAGVFSSTCRIPRVGI